MDLELIILPRVLSSILLASLSVVPDERSKSFMQAGPKSGFILLLSQRLGHRFALLGLAWVMFGSFFLELRPCMCRLKHRMCFIGFRDGDLLPMRIPDASRVHLKSCLQSKMPVQSLWILRITHQKAYLLLGLQHTEQLSKPRYF